ncbi:Cysteine ABC transporter, substrate-binding protein [Streptococcus oralis]|uniref:Cysteine ABC transporter, substrate-binding protein n=1 Tax=Streptococcus oralis TaxID=1303 RepID=A0A139QYU9_STROR|nr:Cysteine ABC transporter, substrate-binding protein [Streptococcus oralis]
MTIVVASANDVPPFDYKDKGNLTGFDIEALKVVDEKLNDYEIQFQRTAWESIFPGLDSSHY